MESRITATEAARTFSDLLSRVRYRGEAFVVERGGEAVCRITPVGTGGRFTLKDLARLLDEVPSPDRGFLDEVERAVSNQPSLPGSPWER